jgi:ABC-type glycerol-3-phosphate transport system substrate-binding protein
MQQFKRCGGIFTIVFAAIMILSGCGVRPGMVMTPSGGATLRVSMYNDIAYSQWRTYVEKQCPNVTIIWENNRNSTQSLIYQAEHGDMADIVTIRRFETDSAAELAPYLADLGSENPELTASFTPGALDGFTFGNKICWYPAPGMMEGIYANTSLFEQYGVKIPETQDEMASACRRFESFGIDGLSIEATAGFRNVLMLEGFNYSDYFAKGAGKEWLTDFLSGGTAALTEQGGARLARTLRFMKQEGVLEQEDLSIKSADTLTLFDSGKSAMIMNGSDHIYSSKSGAACRFIPCLGETAEDQVLYTYPIFSAAVSKRVESDPVKENAVKQVLDVMYSVEAQEVLSQGAEALLSYNEGIDLPVSDIYKPVSGLIAEKKCFIRFLNRNMFAASTAAVKAMLTGDPSDAEFTEILNKELGKAHDTTIVGISNIQAGNQLGQDRPLERLAASVLAQTVQSATGASVVLIESKCAAAPIYKGNYTMDELNAVIADEPLYQAELTGAQLSDVFNDAILGTTTYSYLSIEPIVDYPALSGMTAYLAANGRDNILRLPDGSTVNPNKKYDVVISQTIASALTYLQNGNVAQFSPIQQTLLDAFITKLSSGTLPEPRQYFEVEVLQ